MTGLLGVKEVLPSQYLTVFGGISKHVCRFLQ
jgi:hypothetical protein